MSLSIRDIYWCQFNIHLFLPWLLTLFILNFWLYIYLRLRKKGFSKQGWFWFLVSATFSYVLYFWSLTKSSILRLYMLCRVQPPPEMVATMWLDHTPYTSTCVLSYTPFGSTYFMNSSIPEIRKRVHVYYHYSLWLLEIDVNFEKYQSRAISKYQYP